MNLLNENGETTSMESEQHNSAVDWCKLPSPVLEHIYFYLDKSDQLNMSLVCKSWSQEYGCPSVWKTFLFNLSKGNPELKVWPEVKFAQKFGCMFRHVEIKGKYFPRNVVNKVVFQMQLFFEAILAAKCQLRSIKFNNLHKNYQNMSESEHTNLFQSVLNFMSAQKNLHTVEFRNCYYKKSDGVHFLRLICERNAYALNTLVLEGFISNSENEVSDNGEGNNDLILQYRSLMNNFMNLLILKTDYSQTFENTMCSLSDEIELQNQMTKKLSLIELHCDGSKRMPLKGILPVHWHNLRKICPDVKVRFFLIYTSQIRNHFRFYLAKYIPLVHLEFHVEDSESVVIVDLFRQICDSMANQHLEYLSVAWMPTVDNISTDLIPFLQACKKLKTLQMFLRYPVGGIKELFESWLQNRPVSLESVHLSITRVTDEAERYSLMVLADEYSPLFQIIGLNLILLTDSE